MAKLGPDNNFTAYIYIYTHTFEATKVWVQILGPGASQRLLQDISSKEKIHHTQCFAGFYAIWAVGRPPWFNCQCLPNSTAWEPKRQTLVTNTENRQKWTREWLRPSAPTGMIAMQAAFKLTEFKPINSKDFLECQTLFTARSTTL